jgi:ferredoxin
VPTVVLHRDGQAYRGEVKENTNLVVRAGIRQFPYPHLKYLCGMGKCATCASRILSGGEHLPAPNWKEKKLLGERLEQGYRLVCQLWINHDIELTQEAPAEVKESPVELVADERGSI